MQNKWYISLFAGLILCSSAAAQTITYAEKVQRYISQYKDLAIAEQQRSGIPAAITLAQGILESGAGESELATNAANHFGIKCKNTWTGETYNHDDDAKDECFRKYGSAEASYRDHSEFLKNSGRYEPCFAQSATDYAAWAMQLKKCGYATSPTYAQRLIKIIEDYKLQQYTYAALNTEDPLRHTASAGENVPEKDADAPVAATPVVVKKVEETVAPQPNSAARPTNNSAPEKASARSANITVEEGLIVKDGRRGFWARKGDVLLENAIRHRIRYAKLLEINGLPDEPLAADRFIYLEKVTTNTLVKTDVLRTAGRDESARIADGKTERAHAPEIEKATPVIAAPAETLKPVAAQPAPQPVAALNSESIAAEENMGGENRAAKSSTELIAELDGTAAVQRSEAGLSNSSSGGAQEDGKTPVMIASADNNLAMESSAKEETTEAVVEQPVQGNAKEEVVNIADEAAVEEDGQAAEPAEEEPKDEPSRLKARFDKAVYAPTATKRKEPTAAAAVEQKAAPVVGAASSSPKFYTVQKGETAFSIAKKHGISMKELQALNNMEFAAIKVGQKLRVK